MSVASSVRRMANTAIAAGALMASTAVAAHAQPSTNPFIAGGGNISVRFVGSNAGDISTLAYSVTGIGGTYFNLFTNNGSPNLPVVISGVPVGTEVIFRLTNTTIPNVFYSGAASRNGDNIAHVSLSAGSGAAAPGGGNYTLGFNFEDRFFPPSDLDYNDLNFEIANVTTTPEPSSIALMATGILALGVAARRRRRSV